MKTQYIQYFEKEKVDKCYLAGWCQLPVETIGSNSATCYWLCLWEIGNKPQKTRNFHKTTKSIWNNIAIKSETNICFWFLQFIFFLPDFHLEDLFHFRFHLLQLHHVLLLFILHLQKRTSTNTNFSECKPQRNRVATIARSIKLLQQCRSCVMQFLVELKFFPDHFWYSLTFPDQF